MKILMDMRDGRFFFCHNTLSTSRQSIVSRYLSDDDAKSLGEDLIQRLAAYASTLPESADLRRSLQLDGFHVDRENLRLVPLEGNVSAQEEESRLTTLVRNSGVPQPNVVLKHIEDANSLYTQGNFPSSLNESRNLVQALVDGISEETNKHGQHLRGFPEGTTQTANRIRYLFDVGFFTKDEQEANVSCWKFLSSGSHPGIPEQEQARIGLILALEFGQLLVIKS
jgi:hypothetical protein